MTVHQRSMLKAMKRFISAFIIFVNVVEIFLIAKRRHRITSYESLLLSLSFADLLVGVSVLIYNNNRIVENIFWCVIMSSLWHLAILTIDRALSVVYPFKHKRWVNRKRIATCIVALWIVSLAMGLPMVLALKRSVYKTIFGYCMLNLSILMAFSYGIIIYIAVIRRRKRLPVSTTIRSIQQGTDLRKDLRLVLMCFVVVLSYTALTFPFVIKVITHSQNTSKEKPAFIANSVTNSLVYFFWKFLERRASRGKIRSKTNDIQNEKEERHCEGGTQNTDDKIRVIETKL